MATRIDPVVVTVRAINNTHQTNTIGGQSASSTAGYRQAAQALAHKLFPHNSVRITRVDDNDRVATEVFELQAV